MAGQNDKMAGQNVKMSGHYNKWTMIILDEINNKNHIWLKTDYIITYKLYSDKVYWIPSLHIIIHLVFT